MHLKLDCKCYIKMCSEKAIIGGEMKYDDHALALAAFFCITWLKIRILNRLYRVEGRERDTFLTECQLGGCTNCKERRTN